MSTCLFCDSDLGAARAAFDPWLGRLWRVCGSCRRWNVVPLGDRWEALEAYERAARDGSVRLRTEHLDLVETGIGELIRVGRAPRPELAGWRYGDVAPRPAPPPAGLLGRMRRLLLGMPLNPLGYGGGYGMLQDVQQLTRRWFASPFIEDAPTLTAAFLHVPLAPMCLSCAGPVALEPWSFQTVRIVSERGAPAVAAVCGVCRTEVALDPTSARPALRLGLGIVNRRLGSAGLATAAGEAVDRAEGPEGLLWSLARKSAALGEMEPAERLALGVALDEAAEAELLEREWAEAEELAAIVDGELSGLAGFEAFRRSVLGS